MALIARFSDRVVDEEMLALYTETLDQLTTEQVMRAFSVFIQADSSGMLPAPGKLRELAGESEVEHAREAFNWTLEYLRRHTALGLPRPPLRRTVDRLGQDPIDEIIRPPEPPPSLTPLILATVETIGRGDSIRGLKQIALHPDLTGWEEKDAKWEARRIEEAFTAAFRKARRG